MEWLVSIVLLIIGIVSFILEGPAAILFIIPAILSCPIVLDFLYERGIYISNALKWIFIFIFCIIGAFLIANKEIQKQENIEIINPMDGLILNDNKIMTMEEEKPEDINVNITDNKEEILVTPNSQEQIIEEVAYSIEYYYDGQLIDSATENLIGNKGDKITTFTDKSLNIYKLSKTENLPLELFKANNDLTIRIYYVKKAEEVSYTIRYYYDGIIDSSKTKLLKGMTGDIIRTYPDESKEGYTPVKTVNVPLKLSNNAEDNEMRIYYGFGENTIMDELGVVDGFAPAVLIRKEDSVTHEIIEQYECPYCGSIYNKELLTQIDENSFKCPFCEREVLFDEDGTAYDEEGNELEQKIDNPEQQKISEKYALDTIEHTIHNPLCYYVRKIPSENFRGSNESIEDLQTKGYKICKKCNPK